MRTITLYGKHGKVRGSATVDDTDFVWLSEWRWGLNGGNGYAYRHVPDLGIVYMHRAIMAPGDGLVVDHIDHDRLNNRKDNLRVVTHAENLQNRDGLDSNNTSGYRGAYWHKGARKWMAAVHLEGRQHYLGLFASAAAAGEKAAQFRAEHMPCSPDARAC